MTLEEKQRSQGKVGAYVFALIASVLLGYFCWSAERRGEKVEAWVWVPLMTLIGTSLGVNIDPETVGKFLSGKSSE